MRYCGGGIGHVGAGSNHERDDGWMDDKGDDEDMERQPEYLCPQMFQET